MNKATGFKSGLIGFNKTEVLGYIEELYSESTKKIGELEQTNAELTESVATKTEEIAKLQSETAQLKEEIAKLCNAYQDCSGKLETETKNTKLLTDALRHAKGEMNKQKLEISQRDYKLRQLTERVEELESKENEIVVGQEQNTEILVAAEKKLEEVSERSLMFKDDIMELKDELVKAFDEFAQSFDGAVAELEGSESNEETEDNFFRPAAE